MNSFYVFFPDFTDKNVKINIRPTKLTHLFDYETVQVALYHFIDNATKYVAPDSNIEVSTFFNDDKSSIIIRFEMLSLQIHKDERVDIFKEGYSGSFAKRHNLSGSGIGMARILELLSLNNGYLCLHDDISDSASYLREGLPYSHNTFDFVFNR
ncbi:ATP-binding protein [Aeromonas caviae]|nr:ATP-binding protein [Aeromonas caviae]UJQ35727.1 ATP-binding protein [Aeromonas caviae]